MPLPERPLDEKKPLALVLLVAVMIAPLLLIAPFGYDTCVYQSIAIDLLRYGRVPYIGSWDNNFPGILVVHATAITLFGTSDMGFRILDAIIQSLFALFFYRLLRRWLTPGASAIAAILYLLYYISGGIHLYGQRDVFGTMALVAAVSLVVQRLSARPAFLRLALAGLLVGFSILIRPTSVLFVPILGFYVLGEVRGERRNWVGASLLSAAAFLPCAFCLLYYSAIPGGLQAIYESTIRFNIDVYSHFPASYEKLFREIVRTGLLLPLAIFALASRITAESGVGHTATRRERVLYVLLVLATLFTILVMRKYFRYQFAPFFVLACPLSALGIVRLSSYFKNRTARSFCVAACMVLSTLVGYNSQSLDAYIMALIEGRPALVAASAAEWSDPEYGTAPQNAVIEYLRKNHVTNGNLEICCRHTSLRLHSGLECAGPYIAPTPIAWPMNGPRAAVPEFTAYQRRWQQAYVDTLAARKPGFIVIAKEASDFEARDPSLSFLRSMPGFERLIATSYTRDTTIGGYQIYRRNAFTP